jgi:hypothetical protein
MMLAGVIAAFVIGAVTASLNQLGRARNSSRRQLDAHLRADAAIAAIRRDVISVLRDPDLFWTRLMLTDGSVPSPAGSLDRDEILLFDAQLRPVRDLAFIGEGQEFESQCRIEEDALGPVLWQRRDAVPDEYPGAGGVAAPVAEGVLAVAMEAYDGVSWFQEWDSDIDGLPWALRVTVMASGHKAGEDPYAAPKAVLRTVVPIDRVPLPPEPPDLEEETDDPDGAAPAEPEVVPGTGGGARVAPAPGTGGGRPGQGTGGGRGGRGGRGGPGGPGGPGAPGPGQGGRPQGRPSTGTAPGVAR